MQPIKVTRLNNLTISGNVTTTYRIHAGHVRLVPATIFQWRQVMDEDIRQENKTSSTKTCHGTEKDQLRQVLRETTTSRSH